MGQRSQLRDGDQRGQIARIEHVLSEAHVFKRLCDDPRVEACLPCKLTYVTQTEYATYSSGARSQDSRLLRLTDHQDQGLLHHPCRHLYGRQGLA